MDENKEKEEPVTLPEAEPSGIKEKISRWKMGDYIRQLSIVILGIVVTFWGSDLISDYSKQKEVRSVIRLVKTELKENQDKIRNVREKWIDDSTISRLLMENDFRYQNIPRDTLFKYMRVITSTRGFAPAVDALDVLKSSGLLQNVSDKKFVFKLSEVYRDIRNVESSVKFLNDSYLKALDTMNEKGLSPEDEDNLVNGDLLDTYRIFLSSYQMRSYIRVIPDFVDSDIFSETDNAIEEVIQAIEKKYE